MRTMFSIGVAVLCGIVAGASLAQAGDEVNQAWATQSLTSMPLTFTQNMGQWDEQVLFRADAGGATMWITGEGVMYQFVRTVDDPASDATAVFDKTDAITPDFETLIVKTLFVGANVRPSVVGEREMGYKCNYFHGSDPAKWRSNVPNFEAVVLDEVYPGIDLTYYGNGQRMEYDFVVSPGADHSRIQIKYEGAESIVVSTDGSLSVTTAWGEIKELTPVVYQSVNGERRAVTAEYAVGADNTFGFNLGKDYDRTLPVTIDPELDYDKLFGGTGADRGWAIATDTAGCAYIVGETTSSDFPTENEYQTYQGLGDVFVTKLASTDAEYVYSTYLGGSRSDRGFGVAVDMSGCAYVVGKTYSSNFPTNNAYQSAKGDNDNGMTDAFVTKLASDGDSLLYSTYLGGNGNDGATDVALTGGGQACVTGASSSTTFPLANYYQTYQGGVGDAFVTKLSSVGTSLTFSTYLGGSDNTDEGLAIAVDVNGSVYVTGSTMSNNFPTIDAYQGDQTSTDAFVTKIPSGGGTPTYSTYLGGGVLDAGTGIAVDAAGCAYVIGNTTSSNFPTLNPYQTYQSLGDVFVTKLVSAGSSLAYSTYLGGSGADQGGYVAIDGSGSAYVTGTTSSEDFPLVNEFQSTLDSTYDAFVTRLSYGGNFPVYSSYYNIGADAMEFGNGIAVDASGKAYVGGTYERGTASGAFALKVQAASCCLFRVGDADQSGDDEPTIGDVSAIVDAKFISGYCPGILDCLLEADINQSGGSDPTCDDITISDITMLQDYIFGDQDPDLLGCQ